MDQSVSRRLMVAMEGYDTLSAGELVKHLAGNVSKIKSMKNDIAAHRIVLDHKRVLSFLCVNNKFVTDLNGCEKDTIAFSKESSSLIKQYYTEILNSVRSGTPAPDFHKHFAKLATFNLLNNCSLVFDNHPACEFVTKGLPYDKDLVKQSTSKSPVIMLGMAGALGLTGLAIGGPLGGMAGAAIGGFLGKEVVSGTKLHVLQGDRIKSSNGVDQVVHFLEQLYTLEQTVKSIQVQLNSLEKLDFDELQSDQASAVMDVKHLILSIVEKFEHYLRYAVSMSQDIINQYSK